MIIIHRMKKVVAMSITPIIIIVTVKKDIKDTRNIIIMIKAVMVNMAKIIILDIMVNMVDTKRDIMMKAAITVNTTKTERVTRGVNSVKRKDTKRDLKPLDTITNHTKMIITRNTNSTMTTIREVTTPNMGNIMDITEARREDTRRAVTTRVDTMAITTAKRVITTRDTTKTNTRDTKDITDTIPTTHITKTTERRAVTPAERNTVTTKENINLFDITLHNVINPKNESLLKNVQQRPTLFSHQMAWSENTPFCYFSQLTFMLITYVACSDLCYEKIKNFS